MGATEVGTARLTLHIDLDRDPAIGPGKIRLLEAIARPDRSPRPVTRAATPAKPDLYRLVLGAGNTLRADDADLEDRVLNALRCDPHFQFQQVGRADPGMSGEVKARFMGKLLEVYVCIPPQPAPASPERQTTDCQWIGGRLGCLTH